MWPAEVKAEGPKTLLRCLSRYGTRYKPMPRVFGSWRPNQSRPLLLLEPALPKEDLELDSWYLALVSPDTGSCCEDLMIATCTKCGASVSIRSP